MSSSEQESESSNMGSPWTTGSPHSSPSQQVPHLASAFSGITCDDVSMHADGNITSYLRIAEQPQNYFRFRYKSEMIGTHGCLLGKSTTATKNKTHPTVELMNYKGAAVIRCRLSQSDKDAEHPHKLFEDEQEDRDVSAVVPQLASYKVGFGGMGIIHTAKKDVPGLLFKKYMERMKHENVNVKELRQRCETMAKTINLNIVKLRFSAHDVATDREICPPVFSEPIHNMKSAAVNDLKICRMDRHYGRARGGEDVFLLVEKVNKKNIMVRLFEVNVMGETVWSANGNFLLNDVHHQYAIVFRTPPYKDVHITRDVKVYIELLRPSDGRTSEPKEFVYKADPLRHNKKRRMDSNFSSLDSSSGGSLKSLGELPATVEILNKHNDAMEDNPTVPLYTIEIPEMPKAPTTTPNGDLGDALYDAFTATLGSSEPIVISVPPATQVASMLGQSVTQVGPMLGQSVTQVGPMLGQSNAQVSPMMDATEPPIIQLNSSEFDRLINPHIPSEERKRFNETDWSEYLASFGDSLSDKNCSMDFIRQTMQLVADGGRAQGQIKKEPLSPTSQSTSTQEERKENIAERIRGNNEYNAFYCAEDGSEVKKLVKEICELIKNKGGYNKQTVRNKLERLFELKLSNGDTFLHMTLCSNQSSFDFIVRLIHSLRLPRLLNKANHLRQTILHLAVINDLPKAVQLLVAKGCDPMVADNEGNNAVHYAVICQTCLEPLLSSIKQHDVACDLNAYNQDKQTALHLAAIYDSEQSARLLLKHGASYSVTDNAGRTALHLAALDGHLAAMRALVDAMSPDDIDTVDGCGNTSLQIVCGGGLKAHTVQMMKLLLEHKADPLKHEDNTQPAWRLCLRTPELWAVMKSYVPEGCRDVTDDDVKSEPDDDYESADEGFLSSENLPELALYMEEVSQLLDGSGAWRSLAERTRSDALISWYQATPSPTRTLLLYLKMEEVSQLLDGSGAWRALAERTRSDALLSWNQATPSPTRTLLHLKETGENLTSRSLAMHLQDMGQTEAAAIVRRYISD